MIVFAWIGIGLLCAVYLGVGGSFATLFTLGGPQNHFLRVLLRLYLIFLWPTLILLPLVAWIFL